MAEKYLAVKGFDRFQHYRDRNPPWIKLHGTVLTDLKFLEMPEAAQAQLIKLWVLASQLGHPLPNNPKLLAGKIGTTGKFHLATIIRAGFLIPCEHAASAIDDGPLADMERDARRPVRGDARSRQRAEKEREIEPPTAAAAEAEAGLAVLLASDADRNALTVVLARASDRLAATTALASMLTGNDPATPKPTLRIFGQALRDLATNGERMTARKFRNYLTDAARAEAEGPSRPPTTGGERPGIGARAFATTRAAIEDL